MNSQIITYDRLHYQGCRTRRIKGTEYTCTVQGPELLHSCALNAVSLNCIHTEVTGSFLGPKYSWVFFLWGGVMILGTQFWQSSYPLHQKMATP